jgi:hypothetical protein
LIGQKTHQEKQAISACFSHSGEMQCLSISKETGDVRSSLKSIPSAKKAPVFVAVDNRNTFYEGQI